MDSRRLKQAFKRSFFLMTVVFSSSVVLLAGITALFGELIYPEVIGRLLLIFFMLFFLTALKIYVSGTKWACSKPYILVNIMFAPFYFGFGMLGIYAFNSYMKPEDILIIAPVFLIIFSIAQLIAYLVKKGRTDKMNDALSEFHKEHLENGYEEEDLDRG